MEFALETFWPSTDGWSAARIEEEIVVTPTGHEVITRFPAEQLLVAGPRPTHHQGAAARPPAPRLSRYEFRTEGHRQSPPPIKRLWPSALSRPPWRWRRKPASSSPGEKR